jgi:hypothetical protein
MPDVIAPTFSVVEKDGGRYWCSLSLTNENELIGPFPSQLEAEKDAEATLGIREGDAAGGPEQ